MSLVAWSLTTVARACSYMDITTPTGAQLTALESIINSVTMFIESYIGRRLKKTVYTQEMYDTEEAETLNLRHFPIVSGTTVLLERRSSGLNEDDWETVDSEYYHIDYDSGMLIGAGGIVFFPTRNGYRVTYTAGYDFDNTATFLSDTEAGDVELAAWMIIEAVWNKKKGGGAVESERIGDYSVTYKKFLMENEDVKSILDRYTISDEIGVITPVQV